MEQEFSTIVRLSFFISKNFELVSEFLNRIFLETNSKKWKIFILFTLHSYSRTFHLRITIYEALFLKYRGRTKNSRISQKNRRSMGLIHAWKLEKARRVCTIYSLKIK